MTSISGIGRIAAAALAVTFAWPMAAQAQFAKVEDAIKYRKAALNVMAAHFGRIGAVVKGEVPFDAAAVQANADLVATMARLPWPAFVEGSDKGETRALPAIWAEADKFRSGAQQLQERTAALQAAARTGDLGQVKTAFGQVGQSCKACHDNFRKK